MPFEGVDEESNIYLLAVLPSCVSVESFKVPNGGLSGLWSSTVLKGIGYSISLSVKGSQFEMNFGNKWILFLKKADKNSGSSEESILCMQ